DRTKDPIRESAHASRVTVDRKFRRNAHGHFAKLATFRTFTWAWARTTRSSSSGSFLTIVARPVRDLGQRRGRSDRLPAREKNWRETVQLDPERVLTAGRRIELRGDGRGNAEFGWAPILRNVQVPRQRTADRGIVPNCQVGQVAHGPAPW